MRRTRTVDDLWADIEAVGVALSIMKPEYVAKVRATIEKSVGFTDRPELRDSAKAAEGWTRRKRQLAEPLTVTDPGEAIVLQAFRSMPTRKQAVMVSEIRNRHDLLAMERATDVRLQFVDIVRDAREVHA